MSDDFENPIEGIEKFLGSFDDEATPELFDSASAIGLQIRWSLKGIGFGELVLAYRKDKKKWFADTERMNADSITRILTLAAPKLAELMVRLDP